MYRSPHTKTRLAAGRVRGQRVLQTREGRASRRLLPVCIYIPSAAAAAPAASQMHRAGLEGGHAVLEQADEQDAADRDELSSEVEAVRQALRASESELQSNREQWAQAMRDIVAQMAAQQQESQALETKLRSELSAKDSALKEAMQGIGREPADNLAKARANEQVKMLLVTIRGRSCCACPCVYSGGMRSSGRHANKEVVGKRGMRGCGLRRPEHAERARQKGSSVQDQQGNERQPVKRSYVRRTAAETSGATGAAED